MSGSQADYKATISDATGIKRFWREMHVKKYSNSTDSSYKENRFAGTGD